jgi:peptidylprolyl isomerase
VRRSPRFVAALAASLVVAACGREDISGSNVEDAELVPLDSVTTTTIGKPAVQVPAVTPPELVVTDLTVGSGRAAEQGDTVIVDYVGVRMADGTEFDNSYDRGVPYDVKIGRGAVIAGWEQGLVGAQAGGRRQLDIPAHLAYGDNPPAGSGIQPGDALTFVLDVRAVVPPADGAEAPTDLEVEPSVDAEEVRLDDIVVGDGAELVEGQTAIVHLLLRRGDDRSLLYNTWESGEPLQVVMAPDSGTLPGLLDGLLGMKVGGRRVVAIPPADAFGEAGDPNIGLPAGTDLIVVADLVGVY